MSPPPVSLEKAMNPSLDSHLDNSQLDSSLPDTSDASSTSFLSRSSTLNSFSTVQTQDSDTTLFSQSSPSSDDTVSVPRSLTFPAMRPYAVDRTSLPKGASIRMVEHPASIYEQHTAFPFPIGVSVPMVQSRAGLRNTYITWPVNQGQGIPIPNNQAPPSRHLTFPMERPRTPTKVEDTQSSMSQRNEERKVPELPGLGDPLPKDVATSRTAFNAFRQEMPPDELESCGLQMRTDMFLKSRLTASEQWMIGFLDSKQAGFHCQAASNPSLLSQSRKSLHRKRPTSKARKESERVMNLNFQHCPADRQRSCSPGSTVLSAATTNASSEATMEPKDFRANDPRTRAEEIQESRSPSPSLTKNPCDEGNRYVARTQSGYSKTLTA